ncbi:hypothetical protein RTM1035_05540 [Roseovarius sp. TM1035]|uniref:hypothetical protein n=1 Tax=Roseovarius sp. TM1035 TaxID=391613 RepID=UPI0001556F8C|nr:hypothetical protein [Roseovarius sp. TM1035]AWZ21173.1 Hypothetical protein RAK1035_2465 [Roseovarius sp. AK1035]EDM33055.1 hypothetical protein RTM1035_05540 [Roseovarius sp. TM1035]
MLAFHRPAFCCALAFLGAATMAQADETAAASALTLTLNSLHTTETGGCRLSFVLQNDLGAALDSLKAEAVLFDATGQVATLTLFDFGALPEGRPRVRQFDLAGQGCDAIGGVLINGIGTCEGAGLAPEVCLGALHLASETDIEVTG